MSMIKCNDCGGIFDSDSDPDCFVEAGNTRRHEEIVLCETCRNKRENEWDARTDP